MLFVLAITALFSTAHADPSEEAVLLLSRFPAGFVPQMPAVLDAVDSLAESARTDELSLLVSLATHETGAVRSCALSAIAQIRARHALPVAVITTQHAPHFVAELTAAR